MSVELEMCFSTFDIVVMHKFKISEYNVRRTIYVVHCTQYDVRHHTENVRHLTSHTHFQQSWQNTSPIKTTLHTNAHYIYIYIYN